MSKPINKTLAAAEIIRRWDELSRDGLANRETTIIGILTGCETNLDWINHKDTEAQSKNPIAQPTPAKYL